MKRELLVPKLGLTMTEGVLVEWMLKPGEAFQADQGLFVIESEKAANEIPAEAAGTLIEIVAEAGATLPCGTVIGYWDDGLAGEAGAAPAAAALAPQSAPIPAPTAGVAQTAPTAVTAQQAEAAAPVARAAGVRVPVTPLARRVAAQRGINLAQVTGSGPRGRIRLRDLPAEQFAVSGGGRSHDIGGGAIPHAEVGELRAPTAIEQTIARRLTAAKQQVPHFYLSVEAEVSAMVALREQLNAAQSGGSGGRKFTLNHFVLAAVGRALAEMPQLNRVWTDAGIQSFASSDVGMAVNTERGLLVPVLRNVGAVGLSDVARDAREAITRAQAGRLGGAEMAGGAITVSNAGMHNVTYMSSIINPGQAMILGVGSVRELFRPNRKGKPKLRREMGMVLSADHRVLDGVTALQFLKRITELLENPLALLVAP